jgi:hypothetical protein
VSLEKLKEIVFNRMPVEIYLAHESFGTYAAIGDWHDFLNETEFRTLFGIVQRQALVALVLSQCNLFEKSSNKYPNFSIATALNHFRCILTTSKIKVPSKNMSLIEDFIRREIDPLFDINETCNAECAANLVCTYFEENYPRTPQRPSMKLDNHLEALKVLRAKRIAPLEDSDLQGMATTDSKGIIELLGFAQTFVNIVGYGLFGYNGKTISDQSEFSPESASSGIQMRKLIQSLEARRCRPDDIQNRLDVIEQGARGQDKRGH